MRRNIFKEGVEYYDTHTIIKPGGLTFKDRVYIGAMNSPEEHGLATDFQRSETGVISYEIPDNIPLHWDIVCYLDEPKGVTEKNGVVTIESARLFYLRVIKNIVAQEKKED